MTVATPTESPRPALTALDTTSRNVSTSSATSSLTSGTDTVAVVEPAVMVSIAPAAGAVKSDPATAVTSAVL